MPQFDVYHNKNSNTNKIIPYLLDVQADLFVVLATRVVVPLILVSSNKKPLKHLNPQFEIEGKKVALSTAELAGVPASILGKKITSLHAHRNEIIAALDFLFVGF